MRFDEVLTLLGDCGRYQRIVFVLLCLPIMFTSMQIMSPVFTLATPKHRCAIPGLENDTFAVQDGAHQALIDLYVPAGTDGLMYSKCQLYTQEAVLMNATATRDCTKWVYDTSVFENTAITDTDLVCSRTIYRAHATTALNLGAVLSFLAMGQISDRLGRKVTSMIELVVMAVSSSALIWLPNIYVFIVIRLLIGMGFGVLFNTIFVYAMEFIGPGKRTICGMLVSHFWAIGMLPQALAAYYLRSWRHLQLATSLPIIAFLGYWWRLPKSVRWLFTKGKVAEARQVLARMSEVNKVPIDLQDIEIDQQNDKDDSPRQIRLIHLCRDRALTLRSLSVFYNWLVVAALYYGLSLNVGNLGGDIFVNFAISGVMELVAYTLCIPAMHWLGRKRLHCSCMIIGGAVLITTIFPQIYGNASTEWLITALAMLGKLVSSAAYATIYLFSAELFPTVLRSTAMGICAALATLGGMGAPYIVEMASMLSGELAQITPLLVLGVLSFTAGLVAIILPETGGQDLPDTLDDMMKGTELSNIIEPPEITESLVKNERDSNVVNVDGVS